MKNKKTPLVGITCGYDYEKRRIYLKEGYYEAIYRCGGIAILIPPTKDIAALDTLVERCDGILVSGGPDIDPKYYGEEISVANGEISPCRDQAEISIIQKALSLNKPLLGICRGVQILNVVCGGTLYQDIFSQIKDRSILAHTQKAPFGYPTHEVHVEKNSYIWETFKQDKLSVNSYHHQAIKQVAPCFHITAKANDGIIEAIEHKEKSFIIGVQWHPEMMWEENPESLKLFQFFCDKCK